MNVEVLKEARDISGISKKSMAETLGISIPTYTKIELNVKYARLNDIKLCHDQVSDEGRRLIRDYVLSFFDSETK